MAVYYRATMDLQGASNDISCWAFSMILEKGEEDDTSVSHCIQQLHHKFTQQFIISMSIKKSASSLFGLKQTPFGAEQTPSEWLRDFLKWFNKAKLQKEEYHSILLSQCSLGTI